jgi:hypothetical protein
VSASQTYLHLARELLRVRREHGEDSPHEDEILDQMDQPWYDMTPEDREVAARLFQENTSEQ